MLTVSDVLHIPPLFLSTSLRVRLVIIFAIEGIDACIRSRKTWVLWRINCLGVLSFKSESVSNRH